jgi:hypothetical protein
MKYIDGVTLKQAQAQSPLTPADVLRVLAPVASALDYAHGQGVLHRDIKPSNILIASDGAPWLTDFGLARMAALGASTLSGDMMLGTPHYISPEQALGSQNLTPATDLYALGVVLYELATGRVPFTGDTPYAIVHAHIYDPLPAPSSLNPDLPPTVEAVLIKALAKDPAARYPSAGALIEAYRAALDAPAPAAVEPEVPPAPIAEPMPQADPFASLIIPAALPETPPAVDEPFEPDKPKRTVVEASFDLSQVGESLRQVGEQIKESFEEMGEGNIGGDDDLAPPGDEAALRRRVERQMKKKSSLVKNFIAFAVVIPLLWVIYGVSSGFIGAEFGTDFPFNLAANFPWPIIVMLGWAAGLANDAIETWFKTGKRAAHRLARLHEAFRAEYGPQWYRTAPRRELKAIRKRVDRPIKKRMDFYKNIASFSFIIPMLWVIFGVSSGFISQEFGSDFPFNVATAFPWPLIVMFFWGLGIINDGMGAINAERKENAVEREMERQRSLVEQAVGDPGKPKNDFRDDGARLSEDGELTDSMVREIEDEIRRGRR